MKSQRIIAVVTSLVMLGTSPLLLADPGNGQGKGNAHGQQHDKAGKGKPDKAGNAYHGGPQVDIGGVRITLDRHRDYWAPAAPLPPGIQKNLARGKPLPPGIAKKLDGRLLGQLPHYDGYDWLQAGADLILVAAATGLIYEVLHGALD
ncbi:anti-virulence regulator CigR family protein [Pseudomonas sp. EMN2]|uniref:anti-virulence regulator CigR family protein n=1 Tax=Pseudomonas sp. EMN2 TaxID=2615212 RepID=UPI00129AA14C|nr:anti-virulence regulator CigR family protein [Pseudomonas sp. EMN2]